MMLMRMTLLISIIIVVMTVEIIIIPWSTSHAIREEYTWRVQTCYQEFFDRSLILFESELGEASS